MSNFITNNAYRILGLDGSANQKNILKRSKEIINRLKIEDYPEYDLDIHVSEKFRTEESVNDALKRLQNTKNNLQEYFFCLNIVDAVDEEACDYLQFNDIDAINDAIEVWKNASNTENSTGLHYKKNISILCCLMLFKDDDDEILKESLSYWKEIIDSEKFWISFEKSYAINNDQTATSDKITSFRQNILKYISDIYHDLYLQHDDKKYIKDFQDVFETLGEKTEESLLKPIHESIYEIIKQMKKINLENNENEISNVCDRCEKNIESEMYTTYDDGSVLCEDCKIHSREWKEKIKAEETVEGSTKLLLKVNRIIKKLELQLEQLHETGLYENEQSIAVRDHVAEAIRNISVMIHNDAHMKNKAIELINMAIKISATESMKEKFQPDLEILQSNKKHDEENSFVLEMGGFLRKKELVLQSDYVKYKQKKIFYKDAIIVAYYNDEGNYVIVLGSQKETIEIKSKNYNLFSDVLNRIYPIVEPIIVNRLSKLIFDEKREIRIDSVIFDNNGIHSKKRFRNKSVYWTDKILVPQIDQGNVILFEEQGEQQKIFTTISLSKSNAAVIPSLVDMLYKEFHLRQ